jgi:hypothetical protein
MPVQGTKPERNYSLDSYDVTIVELSLLPERVDNQKIARENFSWAKQSDLRVGRGINRVLEV